MMCTKLYTFAIGLVFCALPFLYVDACSFPAVNVCENVVCPAGKTCQTYSGQLWCTNRTGDICYPPLAVCCASSMITNPCAAMTCLTGSECVVMRDQCSDNGGCTVKAQCNEITRPGSCPPPGPIDSCQSSCVNDARCQTGAKCCPGQDGSGNLLGNFCTPVGASG